MTDLKNLTMKQLEKKWLENQEAIGATLASLHKLEVRLKELEDADWDIDEEICNRKDEEENKKTRKGE